MRRWETGKIVRQHKQEQLDALFLQAGDGCYSEGLRRVADWCGIDRDHVRYWLDYSQRIPDHWLEAVQLCLVHYSGKRATLEYDDSKIAKRKCLRCSKDFISEHVGNRLCNRCKQSDDFQNMIGGVEDGYRTLGK